LQEVSNIKMDQRQKQIIFTILYVVLILFVIGTCIFIMNYITHEGGWCLKDPVKYYSEKTGQLCYCNDGVGGVFGLRFDS